MPWPQPVGTLEFLTGEYPRAPAVRLSESGWIGPQPKCPRCSKSRFGIIARRRLNRVALPAGCAGCSRCLVAWRLRGYSCFTCGAPFDTEGGYRLGFEFWCDVCAPKRGRDGPRHKTYRITLDPDAAVAQR